MADLKAPNQYGDKGNKGSAPEKKGGKLAGPYETSKEEAAGHKN
jgi:hypothetical protein